MEIIMPNLQPGTIVWLKSGSPKMTVAEIDGIVVWCSYFEGGKKHKDNFYPDELTDKDPSIAPPEPERIPSTNR